MDIRKKILKIASSILADYEYIYDPNHEKNPGGGYERTEQGWSKDKMERKKTITINPSLIEEQKKLHQLSESEDKKDRENVAGNPNTHIETLKKLSKDEMSSVRRYVAGNPNTTEKMLYELSGDKDYYVRKGVAGNKKTPVGLLEKMSKDQHPDVRGAVATNPKTPLKTLYELSKDSDMWVKKDLALNENAPVEVLKNLCDDKDTSFEIAFSTNNPELLEKLKNNEDESIRKIAEKKLQNIAENKQRKIDVASNPETSEEELGKLISDNTDRELTVALLKNPNTPNYNDEFTEIAHRFIADDDTEGLDLLLNHKNSDQRTAVEIAQEKPEYFDGMKDIEKNHWWSYELDEIIDEKLNNWR